jgi:citrate synthase
MHDYFLQKEGQVKKGNWIPEGVYDERGISKGLRKADGSGILVGATTISNAFGRKGNMPCEGRIVYRDYDLKTIVSGGYHYEDVAYLLLFGQMPTDSDKIDYFSIKEKIQIDSQEYLEEILNCESGHNLMNIMERVILNLYEDDPNPDNTEIPNVLWQSVKLVTLMPIISINAYRKMKYGEENPFFLLNDKNLTTAENILFMLRGGHTYTQQEADILDKCLLLHAELGGGNNSCFTTQVVSSSGTDTYSAIAAAVGSIKGPKHGGANIKTFLMVRDMMNELTDWKDEKEIADYLNGILRKDKFDHSGLIYGVGHAVFTLSDPRTKILKGLAGQLAETNGRSEEFALYERIEKIAPDVIQQEKHCDKPISANVDFYSGFIYNMLGIPTELFTPMFVNARISGWCAHRIEELCNKQRIVHPGYIYVTNGVER